MARAHRALTRHPGFHPIKAFQIPLLWLILTIFAFSLPAAAEAHQGNPNFRSIVKDITPPKLAEGLEAEVVNFDDHVVLVNKSGKDVVIVGYEDEPYARISADGLVEVNVNSPTYYQNEDRFANVDIPKQADAEAAPDWEKVGEEGRFEWHDHRSHYMSEGIPPQVEDKSAETKVFDYKIPILVGGEPARINGTLWWYGQDDGSPVLPFILLGVGILAGVAWVRIRSLRRYRREAEERASSDEGPES